MTLKEVLLETLHTFGNQTSIAGLNNAVAAKSRAKKIYWIILFLTGVVFTFQGIADVFITYYKREVSTSTDVTNMASVAFPAVTICNQNRYVRNPNLDRNFRFFTHSSLLFRVHCSNLFEEYNSLFEAHEEMMKNNTPNRIINQTKKELDDLRNFFDFTGCREQICSNLDDALPSKFKEFDHLTEKHYNMLKTHLNLECSIKINDGRNCFMWYRFHDNTTDFHHFDPEITQKGINYLKCLEPEKICR